MTDYKKTIAQWKPYLFVLAAMACWGVTTGKALAFNGLLPMTNRPVAKDFALHDIEDRLHRLSDYRGKVVLVNFWATWCPPCAKEMPSMERLWQDLGKKKFAVLTINVGESAKDVEIFAFKQDLTFQLLLDLEGATVRDWLVRGLPTSYVVDTRGRIAYQAIGEREWDDPTIKKTVLDLIRAP